MVTKSLTERFDEVAQETIDRWADAQGIRRGPTAAMMAALAADAGRMAAWSLRFGDDRAGAFAADAWHWATLAVAP